MLSAVAVLAGTLGVAAATATSASAAGIATTTTLSANPPAGGSNVATTFTATVNPQTTGGPGVTGTVTFTFKVQGTTGTHPLGTASVDPSDDQANFTAPAGMLPVSVNNGGVLTIIAKYGGDANYTASGAQIPYTMVTDCFTGPWPDETDGIFPVQVNSPSGFYIGQSNGLFELQVTHQGKPFTDIFKGTITTNARIMDVTALKNETNDVVKLKGKHELQFSFHNQLSIDSVSFFVGCGSSVTFNLSINGVPAPTSEVNFGSGLNNPASNPVTFTRSS
jgi:hypothetical protein